MGYTRTKIILRLTWCICTGWDLKVITYQNSRNETESRKFEYNTTTQLGYSWCYGPRKSLGSPNSRTAKPQPKRQGQPRQQQRVQKKLKPQPTYQKPARTESTQYYSPTYRQPRNKNEYTSPAYRTPPTYSKPAEKSPTRTNSVYEAPKSQPRNVQPSRTPTRNYSQPTKTARGLR